MNNKITITIGIPMYNAKKTLFETLCSINSQTIKPDEVLIVDDCSKDNVDNILKIFNNLPIKVIRLKENQGCGVVRQVILDNCNSDYLIYLDADDKICDMFWIQNIKANGSAIPMLIVPNFFEQGINFQTSTYIKGETQPWCHGKAYNVKYLKDNNIKFPTLRTHEDVALNAILFNLDEDIIFTNTFAYLWNCTTNSITRGEDYTFNKYVDYIDAVDYAHGYIKKLKGSWKANAYLFESSIIMFLYLSAFKKTREDEEMICKNNSKFLEFLKDKDVWKLFLDKDFIKTIEMTKNANIINFYNNITSQVASNNNTLFIPTQNIWEYIEENKDFLERNGE